MFEKIRFPLVLVLLAGFLSCQFFSCQFLSCQFFSGQHCHAANLLADADSSREENKSTKASSTKLQGSVKAVDVEAAEVLRNMGDVLKKIERASLELMGEATRQDYISVGDPDVIGTMIIPAIPAPTGMMNIGPYLPIRKDMMDYYMDQMAKLMPIYAKYTDKLIMPEGTKSKATETLEEMRPFFADSKEQYMTLLQMSKHLPDIDNKKVAVLCVKIHDDMDNMDKLRRKVFDLLKEEEEDKKN